MSLRSSATSEKQNRAIAEASRVNKVLRSEYFPLLVLIAVNLIIGLLTLGQYGESWDEQNYYIYAEQSRRAYANLFTPDFTPLYDPTIRYYGPVYVLIPLLLSRLMPGLLISDIGHAVNLVMFQVGLLVFYKLARRWLKPWSAFAATLLLSTQPLLWGHGIINPKDIPFMVMFMASLWLGLRLLDDPANLPSMPERPSIKFMDTFRGDLQNLETKKKLLLASVALPTILVSIYAAFRIVTLGQSMLPPIVPTDSAAELEAYLRPELANLWRVLLSLGISFSLLSLVCLPQLPKTKQYLLGERLGPGFRTLWNYARRPAMIAAGVVLGLTACIRLFGFAAFAFVAIFMIARQRRNSIYILLPYLAIALLVMYLTYPFLWPEPLTRLLITFRIMLNFPWPGTVLFDGMMFSPDELPWYYLPTLYGIQFTEPLIVLAIAGLLITLFKWTRRTDMDFVMLAGLWFIFPLTFAMVMRPSLYDNGRQFFFILPPLFLFAGFALETLCDRLGKAWRVGVIALILLPGIVQSIALHPYQYIYYNSLVGGIAGASRRFEMDYWATSFRSAAGYLNENAPANSLVFVSGPESCIWRYTRPDLTISSINDEEKFEPLPEQYYVVILARDNSIARLYSGSPVIYEVKHGHVTLSAIKHVDNP